MGIEYISREVWLREATLDLITAGGGIPDADVVRMPSHEKLVAAQASLLKPSTCAT